MIDYDKVTNEANSILHGIAENSNRILDVIVSYVKTPEHVRFHCYYSLQKPDGCLYNDTVHMKEDTIAYSYLVKEVTKDVLVAWSLSHCRQVVDDVPYHGIPDLDNESPDTCNFGLQNVPHTGQIDVVSTHTAQNLDDMYVYTELVDLPAMNDKDLDDALRIIRDKWGSNPVGGTNVSGKA